MDPAAEFPELPDGFVSTLCEAVYLGDFERAQRLLRLLGDVLAGREIDFGDLGAALRTHILAVSATHDRSRIDALLNRLSWPRRPNSNEQYSEPFE